MNRSYLKKVDQPVSIKEHYDAVVVGSGPGGCAVAFRLALTGRKVLVVERGLKLEPDPATPVNQIGHYLYDEIGQHESPAQFLGGQAKFYGAAMYRFRRSDFIATQHESGVSPAWPLDYETIEPYYTEAEQLYKVHGDPSTDPTEPARSAPLPYGSLPHSSVVQPVVDRLRKSGVIVSDIPRALDYGPEGKCVLCPTCDAYLCGLDAKIDAENATLRPALATGNVDVALNTDCLNVVTDHQGLRATGVVLKRHGVQQFVSADRVVVAAGITGSMELLWRSRTERHPAGLGNNQGNLGRYLGGHSTGMMFPILSWRRLKDTHTKTFSINSFYDGSAEWPYPMGMVQIAGQVPYWRFSSKLMRLPAWLVAKRSLMCFYMIEAVATRESGHVITPERIGERRDPPVSAQTFEKLRQHTKAMFNAAGYPVLSRTNPPSLWHIVGTARMGSDPASSVCDTDCRLHDMDNVYVTDASVLPSAGAVNTCLTIVAVALKAADAMLKQA